MKFPLQSVNNTWTLFLDRDGVINERIVGGYVRNWDEFRFLPGVPDAIAVLSVIFDRIIVVTNQQGVGKGLMTAEELDVIHAWMTRAIEEAGGRIDAILSCPDLESVPDNCRKPGIAMGLMAAERFPEIDFSKSVMVGDGAGDMEFADRLGMRKVLIRPEGSFQETGNYDLMFDSLAGFARHLSGAGSV